MRKIVNMSQKKGPFYYTSITDTKEGKEKKVKKEGVDFPKRRTPKKEERAVEIENGKTQNNTAKLCSYAT